MCIWWEWWSESVQIYLNKPQTPIKRKYRRGAVIIFGHCTALVGMGLSWDQEYKASPLLCLGRKRRGLWTVACCLWRGWGSGDSRTSRSPPGPAAWSPCWPPPAAPRTPRRSWWWAGWSCWQARGRASLSLAILILAQRYVGIIFGALIENLCKSFAFRPHLVIK